MDTTTRRDRMQTFLTAGLIAAGVITLAIIILRLIATGLDVTSPNVMWLYSITNALDYLLWGVIAATICLIGKILLSNRNAVEHGVGHLERIESLLQKQVKNGKELIAMSRLSDQAKSLIFYDREIEALRESVNALMIQQDYVGAEAMISRAESRLGLTEVAETLRSEINQTKDSTSDDKVLQAVRRVRNVLNDHHWSRAKRDAERLLALFPNHRVVAELPNEIRQAWNAYKRQLLKQYGEAVRVNDVERSIELLKELDKYLTPQEGAALAESARDVFKKKLHNLGVQFAIAVADQNWSFAVATGEEIVKEYPNSRMAREVREKLELLRDYASGARQPTPGAVDQADSSYTEQRADDTPPVVEE